MPECDWPVAACADRTGGVDGGRLLGLVCRHRLGSSHADPSTEIDREVSLLTEFEKIHALIHADDLSDDNGKTVTWCLDRLPGLYRDFGRTYEIRYGDEIRRLVEGLLLKLGNVAVQQAVVDPLLAMHERLGIPLLNFIPRPQKDG